MKQDPHTLFRAVIREWGGGVHRVYVGLDPGAHGAIGVVVNGKAWALSFPTYKVKHGRGYKTGFDFDMICEWFGHLRDIREDTSVVIERPLAMGGTFGGGRGGIFAAMRQGENFGMWPLYLTSLGLSPVIVMPGVWKKAMKVTRDKDQARRLATKLFPNLNVSLKKDHDRAEAVLMAEYLRRLGKCLSTGFTSRTSKSTKTGPSFSTRKSRPSLARPPRGRRA